MFYLANDIKKPWCTVLKGTPIEVISDRDQSAIIIKAGNDRLTVSQEDITDVKPVAEGTIPVPLTPPPVEIKRPMPAIVRHAPKKV